MADDAEESGGQQAGAGKKGGGKKLIIIIAVAVLLAVGGGVGGYLYFTGDKKGAEHGEEESKENVDPKELLYPLDPFVVNLGTPGKFLKINMQLELTTPSAKERLDARTPQIRDSIIILLGSKTPASVTTAEGKLRAKDEINFRLNQILGDKFVKNVYFTEFVMQ